jgi:hypothetical protein
MRLSFAEPRRAKAIGNLRSGRLASRNDDYFVTCGFD